MGLALRIEHNRWAMTLISTGKAARIGGVTRETIQNYIKEGRLVGQQTPGGHWRLDEAHVREKLCKPITLESALL